MSSNEETTVGISPRIFWFCVLLYKLWCSPVLIENWSLNCLIFKDFFYLTVPLLHKMWRRWGLLFLQCSTVVYRPLWLHHNPPLLLNYHTNLAWTSAWQCWPPIGRLAGRLLIGWTAADLAGSRQLQTPFIRGQGVRAEPGRRTAKHLAKVKLNNHQITFKNEKSILV